MWQSIAIVLRISYIDWFFVLNWRWVTRYYICCFYIFMYPAFQIWRCKQTAWVHIINSTLIFNLWRHSKLYSWWLKSWQQAINLIGVMMAYAASYKSGLRLTRKIWQERFIFIVANLLYSDRIKCGLSIFISILKHVIKPIWLNLICFWTSFLDDQVRLILWYLVNSSLLWLLWTFAQHVGEWKLFFWRLMSLVVERKIRILFNQNSF